ncbi:hypothetical protein SEA_JONJAMES_142 [Gordonia Phage JonJames]|nr:hypothetical protein SEA_JONJAMES_142 [Gordonia Phage JonJames]
MDNPFEAHFEEYYQGFMENTGEVLEEFRRMRTEDPDAVIAALMGVTFVQLLLSESGFLPEDLADTVEKYAFKFENALLELAKEPKTE